MLDSQLKEYVVFRVDRREGGLEIAGESALELEAVRFAGLLAETEGVLHAAEDLSYEVRTSRTGELVMVIGAGEARPMEEGVAYYPLEFPLCFAPA